jgi:N-acyl-D-aspartate/D-glutamate deacylase
MGATVIKGGLVADGSGAPPYRADLAIEDGRIAAIGRDLKGDRVLEAQGAVVAPGFIDLHTHYDAQLFWDPACTPSSWHGVTTVIVGNCGFGLAPCRPENRAKLIRMLVELEDMPAPVLEAGIDWAFDDFPSYLDAVAARGPSLNVGAYIGHSPVRIEAMGAEAYEREATPDEVARMAAIVRAAMDAGAVGFASSSAPSGRRSVTGPASTAELLALGQAMAASGRGIMAMVPGGRSLSHQDLYDLQEKVGRPVTWTALMAMPGGSHRDLARLHGERRARGAQVHPQVSCRPQVAMTTLRSAFGLRTPSMLALEGEPDAERIAAFRDPAWRARVTAELPQIRFPVAFDRWVVSESPGSPRLVGRSVEDVARAQGATAVDALFDLVLGDGLATRFTIVQFNFDEAEVADLLKLDGAVLGLADSGAHPDQIIDAVLPTDLLGKWVREKRVLPIETAVRKLTGELSDLLALDRGYLRVGAPADVTVFDPDKVEPGPVRRVSDLPAGGDRLIADEPGGMIHILVNGEPIRAYGEQVARGAAGGPGAVLRGGRA